MQQRADVVCPRTTMMHGGLGIGLGVLAVAIILTSDLFGFGTMVQQTEHTALFLSMMLFKPMMMLGAAALAWSVWRQAGQRWARIEGASAFPTWTGRRTPSFASRW